MKVAAVVVTYNRKKLLIECLEALRRQTRPVDAIYIIDNASTDGTPELLREKGYIKGLETGTSTISLQGGEKIKIVYIRMKENTGGSGGFHEGVKRAYNDGYDWIWLMDDDAEPLADSLEKLLEYIDEDVAVLCSTILLKDGSVYLNHRGISKGRFPSHWRPIKKECYERRVLEIDIATFVGFLINRKKIMRVGFPKKEFFILYDDVEYSLRLKKAGKILLIPSSIIIHKEEGRKYKIKKFLGKKSKRTPYKNFWREYYGIRNSIWVSKKYTSTKIGFYIILLIWTLEIITNVLIFDDKKLKRIKIIVNAIIDGLLGKFNNKKYSPTPIKDTIVPIQP